MKSCSHCKKNGFDSKADVNFAATDIFNSVYLEFTEKLHIVASVPTTVTRQYARKRNQKTTLITQYN